MSIAEQYRELESRLPADWVDARFVLTVEEPRSAERAASLLSPFTPGRVGNQVRFSVPRRGGKLEQARKMTTRIDDERISGSLELVTAAEAAPETPEARSSWGSAAEQWDSAVAGLPADWSDVYAQVEIASSDFLDRGALLLAPLNPARYSGAVGFRFRVARKYGYGASPGMTRRCFARLDEETIGAKIEILRSLSDTKPVVTQGPVWYVEGRPV